MTPNDIALSLLTQLATQSPTVQILGLRPIEDGVLRFRLIGVPRGHVAASPLSGLDVALDLARPSRRHDTQSLVRGAFADAERALDLDLASAGVFRVPDPFVARADDPYAYARCTS